MPRSKPRDRKPRRCCVPLIGLLEGRSLLSTFVVGNTGDEGPGTLRQVILDANSRQGLDRIEFAIGNGIATIRPREKGDILIIDICHSLRERMNLPSRALGQSRE